MNILCKSRFNLNLLNKITEKPSLFAKGEDLFWDDEHISKGMLQAHLNPNQDAASKNHATIKKTCSWLVSYLDIPKKSEILDLGCGPGLYCEILCEEGFKVTGIDYSKRSIGYAKESAQKKALHIKYLYKDYLTINYTNKFDLIILIYYDFGVLCDTDRDSLMGRIQKALKPGGYFVFDILTPNAKKDEEKNWSAFDKGGFWKPTPYIKLFQSFYYKEENALLRQHLIIEDNGNISIYRLWDRYYTLNKIKSIISNNGFGIVDTYNDLMGNQYNCNSETMGVIARKNNTAFLSVT
jgi:2-polyprenyl-3-methyl-5-hydroxy-6-metoxy-1,4-benzoquinol methylase